MEMASWTPYRSREVIWIKERTGPNGEDQVRTRSGQVMPKESLLRRYEKLDEKPDQP